MHTVNANHVFTIKSMDKDINFYQINLHRAYAPTTELNNMLRNKSSFVVLIQEPVTRSGKIIGLDRRLGNIVHVGGTGKPRAIILASKNINIHPLYHLCTLDIAAARMKIKKDGNDKDILICSSYFPFDSNEPPPNQEFVAVMDYCKINNISLISCIDTNSHNITWGSTNTNSRGDSLLEYILATNLLIQNVGNKPT